MLLKGGKIIPKLAYKRIFTLEKEKKGEGGGKKTRRKSEYIVVKFGVTCRMRIQVKLKKKKKKYCKEYCIYIIIFNIVVIGFAYSPTTPY